MNGDWSNPFVDEDLITKEPLFERFYADLKNQDFGKFTEAYEPH
jgi:hypothetical protein